MATQVDSDTEMGESTPESFTVSTPKGVDIDFYVDIDVVDGLYLEDAIRINNEKAEEFAYFWMKLYSDCAVIFNRIRKELLVKDAGVPSDKVLLSIKEIMKNTPGCQNPPNLPQLMYYPRHKLVATKRKPVTLHDILLEMEGSYVHHDQVPSLVVPYAPKKTPEMTLSSIAGSIKEANDRFKHIENFNIRNAYLLGMWLELAYKLFQEEKSSIGVSSFSEWCSRELRIKDKRQRDMRNFARLCSRVPKILRCHTGVYFFVQNYSALMDHFKKSEGPWTHELSCNCAECNSIPCKCVECRSK